MGASHCAPLRRDGKPAKTRFVGWVEPQVDFNGEAGLPIVQFSHQSAPTDPHSTTPRLLTCRGDVADGYRLWLDPSYVLRTDLLMRPSIVDIRWNILDADLVLLPRFEQAFYEIKPMISIGKFYFQT